MKLITFLFFIFTAACSSHRAMNSDSPVAPSKSDSADKTFSNPLLSSGPDPWVIQKGDYYYYMNTLGDRIGIRKTKYLSELSEAPLQTVWHAPADGPNSRDIWAPELHRIDGKWYLYYTGDSGDQPHKMFVLENDSEDPTTSTWVDKGKIADFNADFFAIDGTTFKYNGEYYFLWSGHASNTDKMQRIYIARMKNAWTLATPRVLISSPTHAWEQKGAPPKVNEGPEILKSPNGQIFLVFSASGCWTDNYNLGMSALKKGSDPLKASNWTKKSQPVFTKSPAHNAYGPGHNSFFKSPDGSQYWIIYHANPKPGQGCGNDRSPRMQQIHWNEDGTPDFGTPAATGISLKIPSR